MESGQSAVESRILSRDVVVSGGLAEWAADGPLMESRQSTVESRILSRDVVVSSGWAE